MESITIKHKKVISSMQADDYEQQVNKALLELAEHNPHEETFVVGGALWTVLTYSTIERTPECAMDEFHLEGRRYMCSQCPLHEDVADRRRKTVPCRFAEWGETHLGHECCEYFYSLLQRGVVAPVNEKDLFPKTRKGGGAWSR